MSARIALIFDDSLRPDTTDVYCRRALGQLADVIHIRPSEIGNIQVRDFDLFLNIDDGLRYRWPETLRPSAWWAIDTHLDFEWYAEKTPDFDWVFTAQRDGCRKLKQRGHTSVDWLPLACCPEIHRPHSVSLEHQLCFVGHLFPGPRQDMLDVVSRRYPHLFVAQRYFDEMARTYSATKIVLNRSLMNDINMRVFEALSCGSFLLTNELRDNGQDELFRDGVHLATFGDLDELLEKIDYYSRRDDVRMRIARAGYDEVRAKHTYDHRMRRLLDAVTIGRSSTKSCSGRSVIDGRSDALVGDVGKLEAYPTTLSSSIGKLEAYPTTSIIIPTFNQIEFTKKCLRNLRAHTDPLYELIVVDNGSSDGTTEYLRAQSDVHLIENPRNRGFPAACNQGIAVARGEQILLLNNDVLVTPGWLWRMLNALYGEPDIGLVGPCSNEVSGAQRIHVSYTQLAGIDEFALTWAECHQGVREEVDRLVGFCLLFRHEVVRKIGVLDERFGIGNFDDDDFCYRARRDGYRCVIARDAFVHHFGSVTFRSMEIDYGELLRRNAAMFAEKCRQDGQSALAMDRPLLAPANEEPTEMRGSGIHLSLCMIVRDSSRTLDACLGSIKPWVDEMIVVDTGSTDDTPEIAKRWGARVFRTIWPDSFAAARNESIRYARDRWIFWMDSDDTIDADNGRGLRELVHREIAPSTLGFVMQVHCPGDPSMADPDITVVDHVKVFRNLPELRFEGRIHEQILPAIRRCGGEVEWTDLFVTHSGSDQSPLGRARKWERDLRLLELELRERPDHPFVHFNLGMTLADKGEHESAIAAFRRCIELSGANESHVRKLYSLLVSSCASLGRHDEAREWCRQGRELFPDDPELLFREGVLEQHFGNLINAERAYLSVLNDQARERHFASIDRSIFGFKARHNLALLYTDMGQLLDAERQWWLAVDAAPTFVSGWRALGDNLLSQQRLDAAELLAARLDTVQGLHEEAVFLKGKIAVARGDHAEAVALLTAASRRGSDGAALRTLCEHLFAHGSPQETETSLIRLRDLEPTDASVHHNLGSLYARMNRFEEAVASFRTSLALRPEFPATLAQLELAERMRMEIGISASMHQPRALTAFLEHRIGGNRESATDGNAASARGSDRAGLVGHEAPLDRTITVGDPACEYSDEWRPEQIVQGILNNSFVFVVQRPNHASRERIVDMVGRLGFRTVGHWELRSKGQSGTDSLPIELLVGTLSENSVTASL